MSDDRFLRQDPNPIPLDALKQPDWDVREYRTDDDIENIKDSLDKKGQVMPVLIGAEENGQYPILDGNHRMLAAKRLGWPDVDCIQTKSHADNNEIQIVANISRMELKPSEKLATFDYMLNNLGWNQSRAAQEVGYDRSQVTRYASILTGYGEIKEFFMQGELGVEACYELNQIRDRDRAVDIAETAVREGFQDKDVVVQSKHARNDEDGKDVMMGAGSEQSATNRQQVKRNAKAMEDLDPVDSQAVQNAQVGAEGGRKGGQGQSPSEAPQEPQGPPCHACGKPMPAGPMAAVQINPELAEELGVQQIDLGAQCTGKFIEWWQQRQQNVDVEDEGDEEPEPSPEAE
jgi:ParB/RepB/Spo0J family partition protein